MIWIGVDAHTRLHQALALGDNGEVLGERTIANNPEAWGELLDWAKRLGPARVWAIAGGACTWVAGWRSLWRARVSASTR